MNIRAYPPLPVREDWTPSYLRARGDGNRDFAYGLRDAQGAPSADGNEYHSAVDWFAPGGEPVVSPVDGVVIDVMPSRGNTGQVFGGVVRVRDAEGRVWVMRHVDPRVSQWRPVRAGEVVGVVTDWRDGGPHLHMEVWRTAAGGYWHENMLDPRDVEWTTEPALPPQEPPHGATLRIVWRDKTGKQRTAAGWRAARGAMAWFSRNGFEGQSIVIAWRGHTWRGWIAVRNVWAVIAARYLKEG